VIIRLNRLALSNFLLPVNDSIWISGADGPSLSGNGICHLSRYEFPPMAERISYKEPIALLDRILQPSVKSMSSAPAVVQNLRTFIERKSETRRTDHRRNPVSGFES
jgi:hypothetical protein